MYWTDESIYKGMWVHGIQHGLGLMMFPDGAVRVGFFEENVYKQSINSVDDLNKEIEEGRASFP
jgi:hypothetical protein